MTCLSSYGSWIVWKIAIGYRKKYESERNCDRPDDENTQVHLEEQDPDFRPLDLGYEEAERPMRDGFLSHSGGSDNHPLLPSTAFESQQILLAHSRRRSEVSLGGGPWENEREKSKENNG